MLFLVLEIFFPLNRMKTTKELARELGLLRKRTLSCSSGINNGRRNNASDQPFKYLIVIDFESTCWEDGKFRTQEIIEFPAVLLNTMTGEVESEFHHYVQPQEQPVLSHFCTGLTGITQDRVDEGIPVNLCLRKFGHWLDKLYREKGVVCSGTTTDHSVPVNTTCVTWSDWDLGVCLLYECKRKQLLKPKQLNSWIDLRATYRKFYDRKPNGLNGALQDLGIQFQGREHSGVDDARNTAKLAFRMIKDGCVLKVTKTLKGHERSASCNPSIASHFSTIAQPVAPGTSKQSTQSHTIPQPANKKPTPGKVVTNKRTPSKQQQTSTPTRQAPRRRTPKKVVLETKTSHDTGLVHSEKMQTPSKVKRTYTCTNKRKQITPVKVLTDESSNSPDKSSNSPCRKIPRKISPKKFSAKNIFVDPKPNNETKMDIESCKQSKPQSGLTVHNMNILHTSQKSSLAKNNRSYSSNVFKKPSPVSKKVTRKIIQDATHSGDVFKVPNAINKSTIPNNCGDTQVLCKGSFCTSTPMSTNPVSRTINQSSTQSPVLSSSETNGSKNNYSSISASSSITTPRNNPQKLAPNMLIKPNSVTPSNHNNYTGNSASLSYRTPSSSSIKTPNNPSSSGCGSSMKVTPPLCKCGRRSKRRMVQSPGQNMGRFFFSCSVRQRVGSKEGCEFFKWETGPGGNGTSVISKQFTPVVNYSMKQGDNSYQKKNLGVRSGLSQRVYIR